MNCRFAYLIWICILFTALPDILFAQHTTVEKEVIRTTRKDIAFIVRKPDRAKNIAQRFHVSVKTLLKLNHPLRKNQIMYAGKQLVIPVWLKRKSTDQGSAEYNQADFELNMDSLDMYVREDFVCMADIEADTIRKIAIGKELKKIDARIAAVNAAMDSIEEVGMRNLSNRDIRKMPMERARRAGNFKIGTQIDSLVLQKKKITEERDKINLRFADYEYLVENAPYMASHTGSEDVKTIAIKDWADDPAKSGVREKGKK